MNEGINLLAPNGKNATVSAVKHMDWMRVVAGSLLFLVSASSVILFIMVALSPLPALLKQEQSLRSTLSASDAQIVKLGLVNERTVAISTILKQRVSLDQTISLIESKLEKNVQIIAIRADHNTITVTLESSSLTSLDTFLNGMISYVQEKKGFSQITLNDLMQDDVTNEYSMTVTMILL